MKVKQRELFVRFVAILLSTLLLLGSPTTAFAESLGSDITSNLEDTTDMQEIAMPSTNENYSYTKPSEGDFLIEDVSGTISIIDDVPVIQFGNYTVVFPVFDYYRIVDPIGNLRYYQADVFNEEYESANFAYIGIYAEDGPEYTIHVHYFNDEQTKLYNILISLSTEQFLYFTEMSTEICLGSDDVSQRLKLSGKTYTQGTYEHIEAEVTDVSENMTNNTLSSTYALNEIELNAYDSYTNSDGIINSYVSDYFGDFYLDDGETITDDPIVNIVPKELFFIYGEHLYVGKEYGFFVRVVVDTIDSADYAVDVMVFDIIHSTPYFSSTVNKSEEGSCKIAPLFQYKYRAADADSMTAPLDPSLSQVVYPHLQYDQAEYFLKDVGIRVSLDNPTALNPGDSGYDPYADNGAFMIQTRLNVRGVGLEKYSDGFWSDTALFVLGFVPVLGSSLSILTYANDLYNGYGNSYYLDTATASVYNNEININTYKTNNTDQIAAYGNLIKSQSVKIKTNDERPRFINVGGYADVIYVIARKSDSTYNKIRVTTSVSVQVVADNSTSNSDSLWIEYGRATGTYETSNYTRLDNVTVNGGNSVTIPANSKTNIIRLIPKVSGSYKLATYSSQGDPNFRIYNATKGTAVVHAVDDVDGVDDKNAALTLDLIGGDIYYIEALRYGTPYQYILRIGYSPVASTTLTVGSSYSVSTVKESYQMFKFIPPVTGTYEISTNLTSGDPEIFLFYSNGALANSDDDDGDGLNAYMECYLTAGRIYYIAVQGRYGNAATFSVTVSKKS